MSDVISFVNNYEDLSTDEGFQFEFSCNRCGGAYRTKFKGSATGKVTGLLGMASNVFGGVIDTAADIGEQVHSAQWEKAHDAAFEVAQEEVQHNFRQCPRCMEWVCRDKCWSEKKGLCKGCAPDLGVEMAAAQADKSVEEVWAHAAMAEEDKKLGKEHWRAGVVGSCPNCEATMEKNSKFCPECGTKLDARTKCTGCGNKLAAGAKFCGECGQKV